MPRLVVLISGNGSNLQAIIDAIADGTLAAEIVCVISNQANAGGIGRALRAGIPTRVVSHQDFSDRQSFDQALARAIAEENPDLIILAGFMRVLGPEFVQRFAGRILNIHPSLLPRFKGTHTHRRAIQAGETEHGASVHVVTEDLDDGPIIDQIRVPVFPGDDEDALAARVLVQEHILYPRAIAAYAATLDDKPTEP